MLYIKPVHSTQKFAISRKYECLTTGSSTSCRRAGKLREPPIPILSHCDSLCSYRGRHDHLRLHADVHEGLYPKVCGMG